MDIILAMLVIASPVAVMGIVWYAWYNPRKEYRVLRRVIAGWLFFSSLWFVTNLESHFEKSRTSRFAMRYGIEWENIISALFLCMLALLLVHVRNKYFQRVQESGQEITKIYSPRGSRIFYSATLFLGFFIHGIYGRESWLDSLYWIFPFCAFVIIPLVHFVKRSRATGLPFTTVFWENERKKRLK